MKIKVLKKWFSLATVLALAICMFSSFSAAGIQNSEYISSDDAKLIALNHIKCEMQIDPECPWNGTTTIGKIDTFYDLEDQPNAYAFNLTNGKDHAGYILVDANINAPDITMYGYQGSYFVNKMISDNKTNINNSNYGIKSDKVYYLGGGFSLLLKGKNDKFYNMDNGKFIDKTKDELVSGYKNFKNKIDNDAINRLNKIKNLNAKSLNSNTVSNNIVATAYTLYSQYDVPKQAGVTFYTTDQFPHNGSNCSPTAGTTLIGYWNRFKPGLWYSSATWVFNSLYVFMKTDIGGAGTYSSDVATGMKKYGDNRGKPATSNSYITGSYVTYSEAEGLIKSQDAFAVNVTNDPQFNGNHTVACFGTKYDTNGQWLRIANGWDSGHGNFYKFKGCITSYAYARWN